jgi:hypothetical protein
MPLRIQFGNPRGPINAFCYVPFGECKILRVAAFAEEFGVTNLFYTLLLDSLRSWAHGSYLQIRSSASWWGRRGRTLKLAPKPPIHTTRTSLLYELSDTANLRALMNAFWYRSPLRLYGTRREDLMATHVESVFDKELVEACGLVVAEDIRFVVERDTWGFFPNVLFAAMDMWAVTTKLQGAARVLSSPLQCDESAFNRYPLGFPESE